MQRFIRALLAAVASVVALGVHAQSYPTTTIRVLVPFAPGGVVDTSTRILTHKLTERLGWTFVVDNRRGGNGFIAVGAADTIGMPPADFQARVKRDLEIYRKVAQRVGIRAQ